MSQLLVNDNDLQEGRSKLLTDVKAVVKLQDPEAMVYLFGSRARNDYKNDSDWDFFVATSRENIRKIEDDILDQVYDIMLEYDELIQVIAYSKNDWLKGASPSPLYDNIREEGILL